MMSTMRKDINFCVIVKINGLIYKKYFETLKEARLFTIPYKQYEIIDIKIPNPLIPMLSRL